MVLYKEFPDETITIRFQQYEYIIERMARVKGYISVAD